VRIVFDVPSALSPLLTSGQAEAILVSSIDYLRFGNRTMVDGVSISSNGAVMSVRLFSKKPFREIRTLALDQSSMTSNALARLVLREQFQCDPDCKLDCPDLNAMLSEADACILIGDNGMRYTREDLHVLDLGEAWKKMTGFPFVWALWVGTKSLPADLAAWLRAARQYGEEWLDSVIADAESETGFSLATCDRYLRSVMKYDFGVEERKGLRKFARMLETHGLLHDNQVQSPAVVA